MHSTTEASRKLDAMRERNDSEKSKRARRANADSERAKCIYPATRLSGCRKDGFRGCKWRLYKRVHITTRFMQHLLLSQSNVLMSAYARQGCRPGILTGVEACKGARRDQLYATHTVSNTYMKPQSAPQRAAPLYVAPPSGGLLLALSNCIQQINVDDFDVLQRLVSPVCLCLLNDADHIHSFDHTTKHCVLVIQPRCGHSGDEELTAISVGTCA